jgi:hypothetical protein
MSIPWGETQGRQRSGGYHLVWTATLVQSANALLATARRHAASALDLAGGDSAAGRQFSAKQLDRWDRLWSGCSSTRLPRQSVAWRLHNHDALGLFHPRVMIVRAASAL